MKGWTFAEKILKAPAGSVVFSSPDIILTHDNTSSIYKVFKQMGGDYVFDPDQLLIVLDHNAPPAGSFVATQYQEIRDIVSDQRIEKFYDAGNGICHQIMSYHARPGMLIVGSDSHTSTAGAFNAYAAGIDRTEAAAVWKRGETWFRVPESVKIMLEGRLKSGVYAKDLALWIIGMIGSDGANYMSVEFHGNGLETLDIDDRMTIANLASEMGAKNAVFPADHILDEYFNSRVTGIWADSGARYAREITIDLEKVFPVVAAPHNVDNVRSVAELAGTEIQEGLIGTCTNGRLSDLRIASQLLKDKKIKPGFQLNVIPASRKIFLQAIEEGIITTFIESGANVLTPSCGACLGTGQGIPADGHSVLSTANRNFAGRMGNIKANIYLASPATVAVSALKGEISDPRQDKGNEKYMFKTGHSTTKVIKKGENRRYGSVWNYSDVDNLNTDLMFAGKYTYNNLSSDPASILPYLFEDFDPAFRTHVQKDDILIAGDNFGCGSSREHPAVGLACAGIKAVIVKSVNRIFYRSSINQGLPVIVLRDAVNAYKPGDKVNIDFQDGKLLINDRGFSFDPLPDKIRMIIERKGLVNYLRSI